MAWLAAFPPAAIYLAVALFTALENAFPFVPSDIGVMIVAALLVREGPVDVASLWAAATVGNAIGALVPWAVARRFGPRIARSRIGRRLLPPETVSFVEREYVRFGLPGIFLCRLLPAVRFIVAPFAGLVGIGPIRTFVPLSLAGGVWYAVIIWGGWLIGGQKAALIRFMRNLNVGLAVVGLLVIGAAIVWWFRRRQPIATEAGARLVTALENAIAEVRRRPSQAEVPVPLLASTVLLLELAAADATLAPEALAAVEARAVEHWGLGPLARGETPDVEYLARARKTAASADHAERVALAAEVWRATMADGALSAHESELLARIASFLSLTTEDIAEARRLGGLQRLT